jgi:cobalamin-dependent methionine synthase I
MATLPGCRHELGALLAAAAAVEIGWDPVFAGAELPADEIAAVVKRRSACAIGLSVVFPPADPSIRAELKRLRRLVGSKIAILVGGSGAASYDSEILEIEARRTEDLGVFQDALEALR